MTVQGGFERARRPASRRVLFLLAVTLGAVALVGCKASEAQNEANAEQAEQTTDETKASGKTGDSAPAPPNQDPTSTAQADPEGTPADTSIARPRFSPDGTRLVASAGADGARHLVVRDVDGGTWTPLTQPGHDDIEPEWLPDGRGLVFASNRAGADTGYDLWRLELGDDGAPSGDPVRLTDQPGDERQPVVSNLTWSFEAVYTDDCNSEGADSTRIDQYYKIAFTRRPTADGASEVWFVSDNKLHTARVSPEGQSCQAPAWANNGLSLTWSCTDAQGEVYEAEARWTQDFMDALESLDGGTSEDGYFTGEGLEFCEEGWFAVRDPLRRDAQGNDLPPDKDDADKTRWQDDTCLQKLPRRYASFSPVATSTGHAAGLAAPAFSANQIVLVASDAEGSGTALHHRPRDVADAEAAWQALDTGRVAPRHVDWSPDGRRIAFDADAADGSGRREVVVMDTDFYLQDVVNLVDFPELYGDQQSKLLAANRFVARPGTEKEFHALYDKVRYRQRPSFVTADAALQAFRDEFVRIIQGAELQAAQSLRAMSRSLMDHFVARHAADGKASDLTLATHFAVAWTFLEANARVEQPTAEDFMERNYYRDDDEPLPPEIAARFEPVGPRYETRVTEVLGELPEAVRKPAGSYVRQAMAHEGRAELQLPGYDHDVVVDFTQFVPRGPYADSELMGYFMAMSWYAMMPLPLDASLTDLLEAMGELPAVDTGGDDSRYGKILTALASDDDALTDDHRPDQIPETLAAQWAQVDALVGAFMGRPVDATPRHLAALHASKPEIFTAFDRDAVRDGLLELRGDVPIRGSSAATGGPRPLHVSLLPRRMGYDVVAISKLTHPNVPTRGFPSALDVMAALGSPSALTHGKPDDAEMAAAWTAQMDALTSKDPTQSGYWSTDVYHAWLSTLLVLARPLDLPEDSRLDFARTTAWQDRQLSSALAGYTQLKHAAVLYSEQESGIECAGDYPIYVLVEQPVLERPRGFVDPMPAFFEQLAALADRVYVDLRGGNAPLPWGLESRNARNAAELALDLSRLANKAVAGEPFTDDEYAWLQLTGETLEGLYLGGYKDPMGGFGTGGDARIERGVAIATDIYTNTQRGEALQIAVGRLDDLYVVVPETTATDDRRPRAGARMTQGGLLSFYEFRQPDSDRLTDQAWNQRLVSGKAPTRPAWTASYLEP